MQVGKFSRYSESQCHRELAHHEVSFNLGKTKDPLDTNLNPIFRYAIKLMKKNKTGGRIVNMSSVNAATAIGRFSGTGIGSCIVSLKMYR